MKTTSYEEYWSDSKNWKWHLIYFCKDDPRVIVPKKPKWMGRTLNFAHRKSYVVLFLTVVAIALPMMLLGHVSSTSFKVVFFTVIAVIVAFYYRAQIYEK